MTIIVNSGSTLVVPSTGLTLTADSTIAVGGVLDDSSGGTIAGGFDLVNFGVISATTGFALTIDTASFTNLGTVVGGSSEMIIEPGVNLTNLSDGTLTGGTWNTDGSTLELLDGTISAVNATLDVLSLGPDGFPFGFEVGPGGTGTQSVENTITEVGSSGVLTFNGAGWTTAGSLNVDGTFNLDEPRSELGTLSAAGGVTVSATGTLGINGEIVSPLTLNGSLIASSLQLDSPISGTGSITIDGANLTLMSPGTLAQAVTLSSGFIEVGNLASGGTVTIAGSVSGSGGFTIQDVSGSSAINALELVNATSLPVDFEWSGPNFFGELILDHPIGFTGAIFGFSNDSTIILKGIIGNEAEWNHDTLTVMTNATTVYTMTMNNEILLGNGQTIAVQDLRDANFAAIPDNIHNDTTIVVSGVNLVPPCFRAGTRIETPGGPVAVERLSPGNLVMSHFGAERRVVWIGHREVDCRRHPDPRSVWPVRILANAFASGQPHTELFLSPDHAVFVDDVLIPIKYLVNGTTIAQVPVDEVTYYHVELPQHDVLLAEGLPAESYLDTGNRLNLANSDGVMRLFPDFSTRRLDIARLWEAYGCAPLVLTGIRLTRARATLEQRAGDEMFRKPTTRAPAEAA